MNFFIPLEYNTLAYFMANRASSRSLRGECEPIAAARAAIEEGT